jgi:hypothetical protein
VAQLVKREPSYFGALDYAVKDVAGVLLVKKATDGRGKDQARPVRRTP